MHVLKLCSDLETPVSVFLKTAQAEPYSFLLESTEHEASFGRYSFIGVGKKEEIILTGQGKLMIDGEERSFSGKPLRALAERLRQHAVYLNDPALPPFIGGAVGYVGYDYVRYLENIDIASSLFPCYQFMIPAHLIIFDHVLNQLCVISETPEDIVSDLAVPLKPERTQKVMTTHPVSNFSRQEFYSAVEKIKEHIVEGDIFQAVLSQRYSFKTTLNPFSLYRALRAINPSPYMFFQKFGETVVLGSSPEMMVKLNRGEGFLKPIAGTRRRGNTADEDLALEEELKKDEKEKAEHVMLLDLGRNDLGKVCQGGSVKVTEQMTVERYSHVMHLVSQIEGEMEPDKDAFDLFDAAFPAGTVSGAPKVRAMQIINQLEPDCRGPYAGAAAYFSYPDRQGNINMDSGLMIRSFFFQGQQAYLQAGAGIVADSVPELEYKETVNKLGALFRGLELAEKIQGGAI